MRIYPYTIQRLKPSTVNCRNICYVPWPAYMTEFFFKLFSLDYMGGAAFEYGQVSDAVKALWDNRLRLRECMVENIIEFKTTMVYLLCLGKDSPLLKSFIMFKMIGEDYYHPTREALLLEYSWKNPQDENRPIAWLCIDSPPFFFTTDETLFRKFVKMLKSKHMEELFK